MGKSNKESSMITVPIDIELLNAEDIKLFDEVQSNFNNAVKYAYNRFKKDGYSKYEVYRTMEGQGPVQTKKFNGYGLDTSLRRDAVKVADGLYKVTKELETEHLVFGGRKTLIRRSKANNNITEEQYKAWSKSFAITIEGSKVDPDGNRKVKVNFQNNTGFIWLNKSKVYFKLSEVRGINAELLKQVYYLSTDKNVADEDRIPITYKITKDKLCITFDILRLKLPKYTPKIGVTMTIDMNPNFIGVVVTNKAGIIKHKFIYAIDENIPHKLRKFELVEIAKTLAVHAKEFKVDWFGYEDLSIESKDYGKGKNYNRKVNNEWCVKHFRSSLIKWLNIVGCKHRTISPEYSSFVGCVIYPEETDCIAAAMELNRRLRKFLAYFVYENEPVAKDVRYPKFSMDYFERFGKNRNLPKFKSWVAAYKYFDSNKIQTRLFFNDWVSKNKIKPCKFRSSKTKIKLVRLDY